ncbi:DUF4368 domain-containing protein, partial [Ruminococcaceae bacterium OttesenSCG-928-A11]|nr:DUF4368 domain-containing protein [Ruminococcaceae bacterium OttesenSCG-928-A11]
VRQYTDAKELTRHMVNELISHIVVYHAERATGEATQKIRVYYNCIGAFEVPSRKDVPMLAVLIPTRKGVALSYANA